MSQPLAAAAPKRPMPTLWASSMRVFDLSLGEMLWSRRTVFLALIVGGPVVIAFVLRVVDFMHVPAMKVNGIRMGGPSIFGLLLWFLFLRFIVPILGIFYGTSLIADEVEDKTITYLFTRPISRSAVLLGKFLAYIASTVLIVLPAVMVIFFLVVPIGGGSIAAAFPDLLRNLLLLALGLCVYGGLFDDTGLVVTKVLSDRYLVVGASDTFSAGGLRNWWAVILDASGKVLKYLLREETQP